ncbi:Avirulence (Avh) protein [Phytophthora megakarya]|uniref:Avirulence (Avh) protein n=1 Tax=Phytophthora megakarya TaxID=4795 RepID=A0A225WVE9_9STRA|nr:Avirulence (Avh) protein [Phytophthora megakarya]
MFKSIKEAGETPQSLYKKLGIRGKTRKVDEDALLNDGNFVLWRKFSEWWGKSATSKV